MRHERRPNKGPKPIDGTGVYDVDDLAEEAELAQLEGHTALVVPVTIALRMKAWQDARWGLAA
jgi:hypothetical protein